MLVAIPAPFPLGDLIGLIIGLSRMLGAIGLFLCRCVPLNLFFWSSSDHVHHISITYWIYFTSSQRRGDTREPKHPKSVPTTSASYITLSPESISKFFKENDRNMKVRSILYADALSWVSSRSCYIIILSELDITHRLGNVTSNLISRGAR